MLNYPDKLESAVVGLFFSCNNRYFIIQNKIEMNRILKKTKTEDIIKELKLLFGDTGINIYSKIETFDDVKHMNRKLEDFLELKTP